MTARRCGCGRALELGKELVELAVLVEKRGKKVKKEKFMRIKDPSQVR